MPYKSRGRFENARPEGMIQAFEEYCTCIGIGKKDRLLLAASGGVDSMVLWKLLKEGGYSFEVAHVNFNLRGEESQKDQQFVLKQAKKDNVHHHIKSVDTKKFARKNQLSIQMAARKLRYDWFDEIVRSNNLSCLLTAHHLDDNFETFLINVNRGTGIKGLTGIGQKENVRRPLMNFSKEEIREFATKEGVDFREDISNSDVNYERNWFRHEIIAPWKSRNPSILKTMQRNFERWNELDRLIGQTLSNKVLEIKSIGESEQFSIASILEFEAPITLLHALFSPHKFSESQLRTIYHCMLEKKVGAQIISQSHQITVDRELLFIEEKRSLKDETSTPIKSLPFTLNTPISIHLEVVDKNQMDLGCSENEFIDLDKIKFPLHLRKWEDGDSMFPLGMKGRKKISDILIDKKVPRARKSAIYVLVSQEEIFCILGLGIAEHVKVTSSSEQILKIAIP